MCTINESIYIIIMSNFNKNKTRFQSIPKKYTTKVRILLPMENNVGSKRLPYNST